MITPKNSNEFGRFELLLREIRDQLDVLIKAPIQPPFPEGDYSRHEFEQFQLTRQRNYGHRDGLVSALLIVEQVQSDLYASFRLPESR